MLNIDKYKVSIEDLKCKYVLENLDFKTTKEITHVKDIITKLQFLERINF